MVQGVLTFRGFVLKYRLPPHWGKQLVGIVGLFTFATGSLFTLLPVMTYSSCENVSFHGVLSVELDQDTPIHNITFHRSLDRIVIKDTRLKSTSPSYSWLSPPVIVRILNGSSIMADTTLGSNQTNPIITVEWGFAGSFSPFTLQFERTTEDTLFSCEITFIDTYCIDCFGHGVFLIIFVVVLSVAVWLAFNLRRRTREWLTRP
jgi:hypothetical protein